MAIDAVLGVASKADVLQIGALQWLIGCVRLAILIVFNSTTRLVI
jgi:hypothetical protein